MTKLVLERCTALRSFCVAVLTLPCVAQLPWRAAGSPPAARGRVAMAYHTSSQRVVLFGGVSNISADYGDTWTWDGTAWAKLAALAAPSPREDAPMALDPSTGRLLLFGGFDGQTRGDTWTFDGTRWDLALPSHRPSPRRDAALAPTLGRNQLVMFGGILASGALSDETWTWNGSDWTQQFPNNIPLAREGHAMATDPNGRTLLFGGRDGRSNLSDTWLWDGRDWTQVAPLHQPGARSEHILVYEPRRRAVIMQGGSTLNDTWSWDGTDWQQIVGVQPTNLPDRGVAYDAVRRVIVAFGGVNSRSSSEDTWQLALGVDNWFRPAAGPLPGERFNLAMAYQESRRETVLFGGSGGLLTSPIEYTETWTFDGGSWQQHLVAGPAPRAQTAMAYDRTRGTVILFGGLGASSGQRFGDTWEWNGTGWTQLSPATSPSVRFGHVMATDPRTGTPVLFGGESTTPFVRLADTWSFQGGTWVQGPSGPSARRNAALAETIGGLLLFGGLDNLNNRLADTWLFDPFAGVWRQQFPVHAPAGRTDHAMAFDLQRAKTVLHSGQTFAVVFADTWEWNGLDWAQSVPSPAPRIGAGLVYDAFHGDLVLALGYTPGVSGGYVNDTLLGSGLPSTFGTFGSGCVGRGGLPYLDSGTFGPWVGGGFQVRLNNLPSGAAKVLQIGFDTFRFGALDLPFELTSLGAPGCWLLIDPLASLTATTTIGSTAYFALSIPNDAALAGLLWYTQGLILDGGSPTPITMSDAGMGRIGLR